MYVVFATPAFDHNVTLGYLKSTIETERLLAVHDIDRAHKVYGGDPYLAKVRNLLVATCLREHPQMTDFFFLDADIEWPAEAVLRLLEHPADVVAGIYPKKNDRTEFPCELQVDLETKKLIEKDGWYKARAVPTGFLRIKRHVLEKMVAEAGKYIDGTGGGELSHNVFQMGFCADNVAASGMGEWWGEDYAWCRHWHGMGGEIWVYPDIDFGHRGQKTWRANFAPFVQAAMATTLKMEHDMSDPKEGENDVPVAPVSPPAPVEPEVPVDTPPQAPPEAPVEVPAEQVAA